MIWSGKVEARIRVTDYSLFNLISCGNGNTNEVSWLSDVQVVRVVAKCNGLSTLCKQTC